MYLLLFETIEKTLQQIKNPSHWLFCTNLNEVKYYKRQEVIQNCYIFGESVNNPTCDTNKNFQRSNYF